MKNGCKKKIKARNFYVVGGGCFGTQYAKWLLRAERLDLVQFEKIIAIDQNKNCQLTQVACDSKKLEIVASDWIDYLTQLLLRTLNDPMVVWDHWVPSPLSPHILQLAFMRAAMKKLPGLQLKEEALTPSDSKNLAIPIQIPLGSGNHAVSFAEWICPVNCIEPKTCPAIRSPRHWDMKPSLQNYFDQSSTKRSVHILQCQHRVHGVGTIPFIDIQTQFKKMLDALERKLVVEVFIATVSSCHGLIGKLRLV